jgi:hypothetical protein
MFKYFAIATALLAIQSNAFAKGGCVIQPRGKCDGDICDNERRVKRCPKPIERPDIDFDVPNPRNPKFRHI